MNPSAIWTLSFQKDVYTSVVVLFCLIVSLLSWYHWVFKKPSEALPQLPPGPKGLPLVGNIFCLDRNLHTCLAKLSNLYGPIMKLKLGTRLCVVINSASATKEIFKDHDTIFSNHDMSAVSYAASYGGTSLVWAPHGEHWRMLRKISVRELLSNSRLDSIYDHRRREVRHMVKEIYGINGSKSIDIGERTFFVMFNVMSNMLWGSTLEGEEKKRFSAEFRDGMQSIIPLLLAPNISDFFPALAMLDIQGLARKMKKYSEWVDGMLDFVISKRLKMTDQREKNDFLQVLLQFKEYGDLKTPFTTTHLKGLFMDMMGAGTKSTSTTVEWALSELLRRPDLMKKAQEEIKQVVGMNNIVEEWDCKNLHYLNAVTKETLRLHPVAPLSVPRVPTETTVISGYLIPKGTKVIVNAWAIQRDPTHWDNPLEFRPERFLDSEGKLNDEGDYNGTKQSYVPFGSGRRICPGIPVAERMIPYLLASLVHSFDWKLPEGTELDMSETFGIEMRKTIPLVANPTPRLSDRRLYA